MLNKDNQRELVYVVRVDNVTPIEGYDRVELAHVGGWTIVVGKGEFEPGCSAVYFEIDSKLPEVKPFTDMEFLVKKKYKIKTQKMCKSFSQGLLMSAANFGWDVQVELVGGARTEVIIDDEGKAHYPDDESRFLTEKLGVKYYVAEDNMRKAKKVDKYQRMSQRLGKKAARPLYKWLYKRDWGKVLLFAIYGKSGDKSHKWPSHICAKTDVDRLQNMIYLLNDKQPYVATEKVDGSSCTFAAERGRFGRIDYYVCSRNVVFKDENQKCYYDSNIYFEAYEKYNIKNIITKMLNDLNLPNLAIQCEVYGEGVQRRDYSTKEHQIAVFHIVSNGIKMPMEKVAFLCEKYGLPHVPILDTNYVFPNTIEEVQSYVESARSKIDGKAREGIVFYDKQTGQTYTKFVSPEYLMKYH